METIYRHRLNPGFLVRPLYVFFFHVIIVFMIGALPQSALASVVAIIDSGIDRDHKDLAGKVVAGYDFTGGNNPYLDKVGHGTAMASIIAANRAEPGLCSECRLLSLKVTDSLEVPIDRLAQAINHAVTNGADVIYVGAGSSANSEALRHSVVRAEKSGVTVVAPAGSQALSHPLYPAAYESVLSVVSMPWVGQETSLSNENLKGLAAPGYRVVAARPGGGYQRVSGSSPAAAWIAGVEAQQLSQVGRRVSIQKTEPEIIAISRQEKPSKAKAKLQYADTDDQDLLVDVPWRTIRSYLPVLFFTPEFNNQTPRIKSFQFGNYDPATGNTESIFKDDFEGFEDQLQCRGISDVLPINFIDPEGNIRSQANKEEAIESFWHYIARIPTECIGMGANRGEKGEHFLLAVVKWELTVPPLALGSQPTKVPQEYTRVMRVMVDDEAFPKFHPHDRHYDIHVHTIAEQTVWSVLNNDAGRKAFGGPIAMLLESAFALGLVDIPPKGGNWLDYKNRIATTDHNVFFSRPEFDSGSEPNFGPTSHTDGHAGEFQWYREHFGELAGEELTLFGAGRNEEIRKLQALIKKNFGLGVNDGGGNRRLQAFIKEHFKGEEEALTELLAIAKNQGTKVGFLSSEKNQGSHFLAYDSPHLEGPWHGGGFAAKGGILGVDTGVNNPLNLTTVLKSMSRTNGFGYAAHPFSRVIGWTKDYFDQAIGLPPYNNGSAESVILQKGRNDFVFKGSQVWNGKADQVTKEKKLEVSDVEHLDPFTPRSSDDEVFEFNDKWDEGLNNTLNEYFGQVQAGLIYKFKEKPIHRFIRKIFMSAGTDAHGDFNYEINQEPTAIAEIKEIVFLDADIVSVSNNAFGRVRTYTLTAEKLRKDGGFRSPIAIQAPPPDDMVVSDKDSTGRPIPPREAIMAYREGNTILTDGPIGKFSVDADCRFDSSPSKLLWHDTKCRWENHDGGIGGHGKFDGGGTALVGSDSPEIILNTIWKGRNHHIPSIPGQTDEMQFEIKQLTARGGPHQLAAPVAGSPGKFLTAPLGGFKDSGAPSAILLSGSLGRGETRARFITNPVWTVPVNMSITAPAQCPIPAGSLKVVVDFGISMRPTIPKACTVLDPCVSDGTASTLVSGPRIHVKPLDGKGQSMNPLQELTANRRWSNVPLGELDQIADARYEASNSTSIPCSSGTWDAKEHIVKPNRKSYAIVVSGLRDMHDNSLHAVAKTFTVQKGEKPFKLCLHANC